MDRKMVVFGVRSILSTACLAVLLFANSAHSLFVQQPCCSAFPHAGASFGPQLPWTSPGVFGVLSRAQDKDCTGAVENTVVMIDRGMESFVDAVRACQNKGVRAVVVRNVASTGGSDNDLVVMGADNRDSGVTISSVFVSRKTGDELDAMLAIHDKVFVELFAADDVNSLMAYVAYLVMSAETLFFGVVLMLILVMIGTRRMSRGRCGRGCRRCGHCRGRQEEHRAALIVNDRSLLEPLRSSSGSSREGVDIENKLHGEHTIPSTVTLYPVVLVNGTQQQAVSISVPVDPNDEPVFEQQEQ